MTKPVVCKHCGGAGHYRYQCFRLKKTVPKTTKRPRQLGRRGLLYKDWHDNVAIPYLTAKFGYRCAVCGSQSNLDVAHILGRGSHAQLKMELSNVRLLCRAHHLEEHGAY